MQIASTCKGCTCDKCESLKDKSPPDDKLNNEKCQSGQSKGNKSSSRARPAKMKIRYTYGNHHRLDHTYAAAAAASVSDVLNLKPLKSLMKVEPTSQWFKKQHNALLEPEGKQQVPQQAEANAAVAVKQNPAEDNECRAEACGQLFIDSTKNDTDEINLKSTWLRNLCLEYQPSKNSSKSQLEEVVHSDDTLREKHTHFHFSRINGTLKQYQKSKKVHKSKTEVSSSLVGNGKVTKSVQEDKKRWIAALALIELAQSK